MVNLFSREHNKRTRFTRMCIGEAVFVLMDKKEYEDIEKSANILEHIASTRCNTEIQKAQNFYNGYQQGIEDLLKYIRTSQRRDEDV